MANRMQYAAEWQTRRLEEHASTPVVYRVPGRGEVTVDAVMSSRTEETDTITGLSLFVRKPDFSIRRESLVVAGEIVKPERGHEIDVTLEGDTVRYEVIGPPEDSTRFNVRWRIHATAVKVL